MPNGRTVRCTNCSYSWFQDPPDDNDQILALDDGEFTTAQHGASVAALPSPEGRHFAGVIDRAGVGRFAVVFLMGAVVLSAIVSLVLFRSEVVRAWPPAEGLYTLTGLGVNAEGLVFRETKYSRRIEDGTSVIIVEGKIVNETGLPQPVPAIRVTLRDSDAHPLDHWEFAPFSDLLEPNQSHRFETRRSSPPANAYDLEVRFVEDRS